MRDPFKGIVSRDFRGLQVILMDRAWVPGIQPEVYLFVILLFHIELEVQRFQQGFYALSKTLVFYNGFFSSPGLTKHRRSDLKLLR